MKENGGVRVEGWGWSEESGGRKRRVEGLTMYEEKDRLIIYEGRGKDNSPSHLSWKKTGEEFLTLYWKPKLISCNFFFDRLFWVLVPCSINLKFLLWISLVLTWMINILWFLFIIKTPWWNYLAMQHQVYHKLLL